MLVKLSLLLNLLGHVISHGYLDWPPQRSSLWRHGFHTPKNYNDNSLYCGGRQALIEADGKCGACGDAFFGAKDHEAGGKYAQGVIAESYPVGTEYIRVKVKLTTHHKGFFEFRICPHNNPNVPVSQKCLDQNLLHIKEADEESGFTKFYPERHQGIDIYHLHVEIPPGMTCSQCVLSWRYKTGNSWGTDPNGRSCLGCGLQEEFRNCADIRIGSDASSVSKEVELHSDSASGGSDEVYFYNKIENSGISATTSGLSDIIIDNSLENFESVETIALSKESFSKEHFHVIKQHNNLIGSGSSGSRENVMFGQYTPATFNEVENSNRIAPVRSNHEFGHSGRIMNPIAFNVDHSNKDTALSIPSNKNIEPGFTNQIKNKHLIQRNTPVMKQNGIARVNQNRQGNVAGNTRNRNIISKTQRNTQNQQMLKNIQRTRNLLTNEKAREIFLRLQRIKNMRAGLSKLEHSGRVVNQPRAQPARSNFVNSGSRNMFVFSPNVNNIPPKRIPQNQNVDNKASRTRFPERRIPTAQKLNTPNNILILRPPLTTRISPSINTSQRRTNIVQHKSPNRQEMTPSKERMTRRNQENHQTRRENIQKSINRRTSITANNRNRATNENNIRNNARIFSMQRNRASANRRNSVTDINNARAVSPANNRISVTNNNRRRTTPANNRNFFWRTRGRGRLAPVRQVRTNDPRRQLSNFNARQRRLQNLQNRSRVQNTNSQRRQPLQMVRQRNRSGLVSFPTRQELASQRVGVGRQSLPLSRPRTVSRNQIQGRQPFVSSRTVPSQRGVRNNRRSTFSQRSNMFFG